MTKYEYNVIVNNFYLKEALLNELGSEGWELVSHAYNSNPYEGHVYTFKKEKVGLPRGIANTLTPEPDFNKKPTLICGKHFEVCDEDSRLCPKCLEESNK